MILQMSLVELVREMDIVMRVMVTDYTKRGLIFRIAHT